MARPEIESLLVAYLDGELSNAERQAVEASLAANRPQREVLNSLEGVWDCLDHLPQPEASDQFTRTTIEMITVQADRDLASLEQKQTHRRRARSLLTAGLAIVSLLAGVLTAATFWPNPDRALLRDLALLKNLDAYLELDDVQLLQALHERKLFAQQAEGAAMQPDFDAMQPAERRHWIIDQPDGEKARLRDAQQRFEQLSATRQKQVRRIHAELRDDPHAAELQIVLDSFYQWLITLSPGQRGDLWALDIEPRVRKIASLRKNNKQHGPQSERLRPLTPKDIRVLLTWTQKKLKRYVKTHRDELVASLPDRFAARFAEANPSAQRRLLMMMAWRRLASRRGRLLIDHDQALIERLSPAAQARLANLEDREAQQRLLLTWIRTAAVEQQLGRRTGGTLNAVSNEALEQVFVEQLSMEQRERLLALPVEQMQAELRKHYFQSSPGPPPLWRRGGPPWHRPEFGPHHEPGRRPHKSGR